MLPDGCNVNGGTGAVYRIPEALGQGCQGRFQIGIFLQHLLGVNDQIVDLLAGGKDRAVGIGDVSPLVRKGGAGIAPPGKHLLGILFSVFPLDPCDLIT